jgi:hypothetical protein
MEPDNETPLFHGKFIPNQPHRLPLIARVAIGIGLAVLITAYNLTSSNVLLQFGWWVTPLIVSVISAASIAVWIIDEIRHPQPPIGEDTP